MVVCLHHLMLFYHWASLLCGNRLTNRSPVWSCPCCPLLKRAEALLKLLSAWSPQADERYRKNVQGSPQSAQTKPQQPPVPPRSESYADPTSETTAMHRPVEPQVRTRPHIHFSLILWSLWVYKLKFFAGSVPCFNRISKWGSKFFHQSLVVLFSTFLWWTFKVPACIFNCNVILAGINEKKRCFCSSFSTKCLFKFSFLFFLIYPKYYNLWNSHKVVSIELFTVKMILKNIWCNFMFSFYIFHDCSVCKSFLDHIF